MLRWGIWLGPVILLIVALGKMPFGYYEILRVVVCCASAHLAFEEGKIKNSFWLWLFVASALTYNPIAKLALGRAMWEWINFATIALFSGHFFTKVRRLPF